MLLGVRSKVVKSSFAAGVSALLLLQTPAWALYKVVGPDGKVTYTDRAPTDRPVQALKSNGAAAAIEGLPFELQGVVARYPVTLYSAKTCSACDSGRQLLQARGVPFTEKTVITNEDIKLFQKLENTEQVPVLRIGSKQVLGFSQSEWASYLDAAGYPAKSALPANYRAPAPTPLAPPRDIKPAQEGKTPANMAPPPADTGTGPAGIRF
jgi:glutaredoxin